jgi:hypothetical protein
MSSGFYTSDAVVCQSLVITCRSNGFVLNWALLPVSHSSVIRTFRFFSVIKWPCEMNLFISCVYILITSNSGLIMCRSKEFSWIQLLPISLLSVVQLSGFFILYKMTLCYELIYIPWFTLCSAPPDKGCLLYFQLQLSLVDYVFLYHCARILLGPVETIVPTDRTVTFESIFMRPKQIWNELVFVTNT